MNSGTGPFPDGQQTHTRWGVTFTPWHDPVLGVGFRADRDGLTVLVYLRLPTDPGNGRNLSVEVCTRTGDVAEDGTDAAGETVRLDLIGPVTTRPWTDGCSVGWHIEGLHDSGYVYLTPAVDGDRDEDVADVRVCAGGGDDPSHAGIVLRLPVHDRTAEPRINAGPVTGPGVMFDPAAFAGWFRTTDVQHALAGLLTAPYDSADPDDSAALRAQLLLFEDLPAAVWRLGTGVSRVTVWPTTDPQGAPAGDGGAVITVRYGPVELSAGHLAADELVRCVYIAGTDTVGATALHAAIQALTEIAERVNTTIRHCTAGAVGAALQAAPDGAPGGVPVHLVTGCAVATITVDPDLEDAVAVVGLGDLTGSSLDVIGVDFNANTVGVWTGNDPDNQEWTVVAHLDPARVRELRRPSTTS